MKLPNQWLAEPDRRAREVIFGRRASQVAACWSGVT